jgi:ketopantoate reductase
MPNIASQFPACGIRCSVAEDLALERWRKLVWNIPFNGLNRSMKNVDKIDNRHEEQFKICGASENQRAQSSKNCSG